MCNNHIILLYLTVCFNQNSSQTGGIQHNWYGLCLKPNMAWRQALSWWSAHQSTCATQLHEHYGGGRNWQNDVLPFPFLYWVATSSLQIVLYVIACHHRSAWGSGVSWNPACCLRQAINDDVAANQWQQVSTNEIFRNRLPVVNMVVVFLCFCGCAWGELFVSPCIVVFSAGLWFLPFGRSHVSDVFIVVLSCHGAFRAPPSRPGSPRRWETPQKPVHISISKPV